LQRWCIKRSELKFIKKKRERKAAALIALAMEKEGGAGGCLTDEEMASLVEGSCSTEDKERGWLHLSDCAQCYERWYVLKSGKEPSKKEGMLIYLRRRKNLALAGSVLAVAASVAVILNIIHDPLPGKLVEKPVLSVQMAEEAETSFLQAVEGGGMADQTDSLQESELVPEATERERRIRQEAKLKRRQAATALGINEVHSRTTLASETKVAGISKAEQATGSGKGDSFELWLEKVQQGCLEKRQEKDFWLEIARSGEHLQAGTTEKGAIEKEAMAAMAVLKMVPDRYDPDTITKQCGLIVAKLAEDGNNR